MGCWLDFSDRLHQSVSDNDADISSWITVCPFSQIGKVSLRETVRSAAQVKLEHEGAGVLFRQGDIDPLLKSEGSNS